MAEFSGAGTWVHTNVFAGGKLLATYSATDNDTHFPLTDWLGTKRAELTTQGKLSTFYSLPFGNGLQTGGAGLDATEHHFTGKERDAESGGMANGNDYFGARYYNSATGRWLSPDWSAKAEPVPYAKLDNPQSLNLYAYLNNNPLRTTDPDGHEGSPCTKNQAGCTVTITADPQQVVRNPNGSMTITQTSPTLSVSEDKKGNITVTTGVNTTTVEVDTHGAVTNATSETMTTSETVDRNGKTIAKSTSITTVPLEKSDPKVVAMNSKAQGFRGRSATGWLGPIPVVGAFLQNLFEAGGGFTYRDVIDSANKVAPYYCPSPTGCGHF